MLEGAVKNMNTSRPGSLGGIHLWRFGATASNISYLTFSAQHVLDKEILEVM